SLISSIWIICWKRHCSWSTNQRAKNGRRHGPTVMASAEWYTSLPGIRQTLSKTLCTETCSAEALFGQQGCCRYKGAGRHLLFFCMQKGGIPSLLCATPRHPAVSRRGQAHFLPEQARGMAVVVHVALVKSLPDGQVGIEQLLL